MEKTFRKKLTNSSGAICVFAILALVFSLLTVFFDPLATLIHNAVFKHDIDNMFLYSKKDFVQSAYLYFMIYGTGAFLAVLSCVSVILFFKNKKKKGLSSTSASLLIFSVIGILPLSVFGMIQILSNSITKIKNSDTDQTVFLKICELLVFCIPLLAGFFLLLAGLFLALKLSSETFTVEIEAVSSDAGITQPVGNIPVSDPFPGVSPVNDQFNRPMFNNEQQSSFAPPPVSAPAAEEIMNTAASVKNCPNCGAELSGSAKFCRSCGQKIM